MSTATISSKGWVVIPKQLRERYGLKPGMRVHFVDYGGILSLVPEPQSAVQEGLGILARFGEGNWTQALLKERAAEREQEESFEPRIHS
jgi:AbrB family looped-hinge helix DNA binding protein